VLLYGVNVTAYTIESDLDNEYLLMYCMNESGDKQFYQYDRQEKSLQRYTGELIDKVNANASDGNGSENMNAKQYQSNLRQMAIIIAVLAALCVMLVMAVINIVLKQSKRKNVRTRDELDF
jgi:putative cohesin domain protein